MSTDELAGALFIAAQEISELQLAAEVMARELAQARDVGRLQRMGAALEKTREAANSKRVDDMTTKFTRAFRDAEFYKKMLFRFGEHQIDCAYGLVGHPNAVCSCGFRAATIGRES